MVNQVGNSTCIKVSLRIILTLTIHNQHSYGVVQDSFGSLLILYDRRRSCMGRGTIRIYHECEGRIEKSIPKIAVWHYGASRVMSNGIPEGRIFLSYPHTNNGFFFLLTTCLLTLVFIYLFIYLFIHLFIHFKIIASRSP